MATDLYAMVIRHPWLVQALGSYVVYGPGKARHDDHSLAIYEAAGFTGERADRAIATVFTFVLGNAIGPAAASALTRKLGRDGGNATELLRDHLAGAREVAARFPRLRDRLDTAAVDYGAAPEHSGPPHVPHQVTTATKTRPAKHATPCVACLRLAYRGPGSSAAVRSRVVGTAWDYRGARKRPPAER
jgi:hypothetical protein